MENLEFLLVSLINKLGTLFMFAFIISKLKAIRTLINKQVIGLSDKIKLSIIFGLFGIIGSYLSIEFNGALINTRIIGVATGGILGGPLVGFLAGLIAGVHRLCMPVGLFTKVACGISVPLEGLVAGLLGRKLMNKKHMWLYAAGIGGLCELMRKVSVLIFAKPFDQALVLVQNIWLPMVVINSIGVALQFLIIDNIFKDRERVGAQQFNLSINIVDRILPFLKENLYTSNTEEIVKIIKNKTAFDSIMITDQAEIISGVVSSSTPVVGGEVTNQMIQIVLNSGEILCSEQFNLQKEVKSCALDTTIVAPLKDRDSVVGTIIFYKEPNKTVTEIDKEIAWSLSKLISNRMRLNRLEENSKLLVEAELRSLQAQINPHFLFNSLSVIASLCRTNSAKARELILHLAHYFRNNLDNDKKLIPLTTELSHVKSYIEIEKARFGDKLEFIDNINQRIDCLIPPLTLQPIVENAIQHGILNQKEGGKVEINYEVFEGYIIVSVYDDGIGMTEKQLEKFSDNSKKTEHIGLYNVNQRLKGMFGKDFGLSISSKYGEYTQVDLKVPIIKE